MVKKGFSLIEVLIGALIIAIALGGLLSVFVGSRKYIHQSQKRLSALNLGRDILDQLRGTVRASDWNAATPLAVGSHTYGKTPKLEKVDYTITYEVSNAPAINNFSSGNRKVKVKIQYPQQP